MSPTRFAVENARLDREAEPARRAGDIPGLQAVMAGKTQLLRAYYGHPLAA
jgi:hypothetical protein